MVLNPGGGRGGRWQGQLGKAVLRPKQVEAALPRSLSRGDGSLADPALPTVVAPGLGEHLSPWSVAPVTEELHFKSAGISRSSVDLQSHTGLECEAERVSGRVLQ